MTSTAIYRAIVVELERKRQAMGMSMEAASEIFGAERSWSKMLYPDTPSGRQASWDKLQRAVDVMFPDGFEVILRPGATKTATTEGTKRLIRSSAAHYDRRTQREVMREIGSKGGKATAGVKKRQPPKWKRVARARRAAKQRWSTPKIIEITGTSAAKNAMLTARHEHGGNGEENDEYRLRASVDGRAVAGGAARGADRSGMHQGLPGEDQRRAQ